MSIGAHASFEGDTGKTGHNQSLSSRRLAIAQGIIASRATIREAGFFGFSRAQAAGRTGDQNDRVAEITGKVPGSSPAVQIRATLERAAQPSQPPATPDKPPATPDKPPATPDKPPATPATPATRRHARRARHAAERRDLPGAGLLQAQVHPPGRAQGAEGHLRPQEGCSPELQPAGLHGADARHPAEQEATLHRGRPR